MATSLAQPSLVRAGLRHSAMALDSAVEEDEKVILLPVPRSDDDLWRAVKTYLNIEIPRQQVCPHHSSPFQAFADAFFARYPITVWYASRGLAGKSFMLGALSMIESLLLRARVNLLGGSGEQAERVLNYMYAEEIPNVFWEAPGAPRHLVRGGYEKGALKRETRLVHGGRIRALMASQRSVRGPHPERLRLDEIDEMSIPLFDAAMGQTMATRGIAAQTVASSTWHNSNGTMTEVMERAKEKDWPIYEWCYKETLKSNGGWLPDEEVERKRTEMTAVTFSVEVELQEPNPESRAISPEKIPGVFKAELGKFDGKQSEYIEIELSGVGEFFHGTDWAKRKDWTIIVTLQEPSKKGDPYRVVAFERRGRQPWPVMVSRLEERVKNFGGHSAHDETGIGDVIGDYIEGIESKGVWLSGKTRATILSDYITALEHHEIEWPMIKWAFDEHRLASVDDVFGSATKDHCPDSIIAGALAWWIVKNKPAKKKARATWGS